ncbi:hypothetical protein ABW19_dt0206004 [Dactylella cylindrospora]|nr:hypothetical protein ABW19_dt0206004 [Dactylella cylindrospora]
MSAAVAFPFESSQLPRDITAIGGDGETIDSGIGSNPNTPSRKTSRFRSVKDILCIDTPEASPPIDIIQGASPAPSTLKRPSKSIIAAKKSTGSKGPTSKALTSRNGRIAGKITKSSTAATAKPMKEPGTFDVYAIPSSPAPTPQPQDLFDTPPRETNNPQAYVPAKRIWTPVKENSQPVVIDLCSPDDVKAASFTSILSAYMHEDVSGASLLAPSNNELPTKRRCLEVVEFPNIPNKTSKTDKEEVSSKTPATKPKRPRKKAKTLTDLAIAPYITTDAISTEVAVDKPLDRADEDNSKKINPPKRKKKATAKKTPKQIPKKSVLLSPGSVQKRLDEQTFIFGTSSQLAKEDPPQEGWVLETTGRKMNTIQTHARIHARASYDLSDLGPVVDLCGVDDAYETPLEDAPKTECAVDTTGWGIADLDISRPTAKTTTGGDKPKGIGLWSMASRGHREELHEVEVMDLVDEDDLEDILSQRLSLQGPGGKVAGGINPQAKATKPQRPAKGKAKKGSVPPLDIVDGVPCSGNPLPTVHWTQLPSPITTQPEIKEATDSAKFPKSKGPGRATSFNIPLTPNDSQPLPNNSNPIQAELPSSTQLLTNKASAVARISSFTYDKKNLGSTTQSVSEDKPNTEKTSLRPNFEGWTLPQLQAQIAKYGFKPVKSRNTMIEMLNRCWDSAENSSTADGMGVEAEQPKKDKAKTKPAAKGRKKKDLNATVEDEGDAEASAPKKRGRKRKVATEPTENTETPKPKRTRKSTASETPASSKKPAADFPAIFQHIATAIKFQPTSPSLKNPSWWQRILMNDTIVLEDFTDWLLETGFREAGVDENVWVECGVCESSEGVDVEKVNAVKKWCEARSVSWVKRKAGES